MKLGAGVDINLKCNEKYERNEKKTGQNTIKTTLDKREILNR